LLCSVSVGSSLLGQSAYKEHYPGVMAAAVCH